MTATWADPTATWADCAGAYCPRLADLLAALAKATSLAQIRAAAADLA